MLLIGETSFFVRSFRHFPHLQFFWYKTWLQNSNLRLHHKPVIKELEDIKKFLYTYDPIIAQKLPILKQGVKTINTEFIRTRALSQLSLIQFRPYAISFPGLLLSLRLMPKSKKNLEASLDLTSSLKTSADARVEGLISNLDYLENRRCNFI